MRLATIQTESGPRAALVQGDFYIDLHGTNPEFPASMRQLLELGTSVLRAMPAISEEPKAVRYPAASVKLLPPVPDPQKIFCVGLNYRDHARETNKPLPREPVIFSKFATALIGHGQPIVLPKVSTQVDYEAELVVVVGKTCRHLDRAGALAAIAGYTVGHDVSARDWQFKDGGQWLCGKTFDTFGPTGPAVVTADEVPDPLNLGIRLRLNGEIMQDSNTRELIFSPADVLAYVSQVVTLHPGDLVFTGTPSGVGAARKPPVWLKPGDVAEVEIDGLGVLRNPVVGG